MMAADSGALLQAKLVLLGDMGAGKSSLVLRFVKGQFFDYQARPVIPADAPCPRLRARFAQAHSASHAATCRPPRLQCSEQAGRNPPGRAHAVIREMVANLCASVMTLLIHCAGVHHRRRLPHEDADGA